MTVPKNDVDEAITFLAQAADLQDKLLMSQAGLLAARHRTKVLHDMGAKLDPNDIRAVIDEHLEGRRSKIETCILTHGQAATEAAVAVLDF